MGKREVIIIDGSEGKELLAALAEGRPVTAADKSEGLNAEQRAMLQALYSRSPKTVREHLKKVADGGADKFMSQYYVKYGHKSIGDCGFITIFVEGCGMLVAKAFQDTQLYNGQEASTRYLDFTKAAVVDPIATPESAEILKDWIDFNAAGNADEEFRAQIKARFPRKPDEKEDVYDRAITARIFDIMRGFLPFGTTTFVAWTVNLRQAADRLQILRNHPLAEVRDSANEVLAALKLRYPNSFGHAFGPEQDSYWYVANERGLYAPEKMPAMDDVELTHTVDTRELAQYRELLDRRPKYTELPAWMSELGQIRCRFFLDGGSWRDLQRQRAGVIRFPLFETRWGFYPWYLEQLSDKLRGRGKDLIGRQIERINALPASPVERQQYLAMGFSAPVQMTFTLPGLVYLIELRSGKTVHPTLRLRAQQLARALHREFPDLRLYADMDEDDWSAKRGTQTIMTAEGKAVGDI